MITHIHVAEGYVERVQLAGAEASVLVRSSGLPRELESRVHCGSTHCLSGARADDERVAGSVVARGAVPVVKSMPSRRTDVFPQPAVSVTKTRNGGADGVVSRWMISQIR
ncbi:hypothetical protein HPB48_007523 [Haemaphysalis longicornis]|uniref:Uncharacterized protein n=1 Tax=Haemaphysalis longicornis TaxID=44386 RepID=A0A9J6GTF7_HAELO|nr:hypothetical protein HPB48_007523 [Haemaphysalis longicornis]